MISIEKITKLLNELQKKAFFGNVLLIFKNGEVTLIKYEKCITDKDI